MSFERALKRQSLKRKESREPDYIDSWKEWQDKQFVSGYYSGGRIPYFFKDIVSPRGTFYIICGCFLFGLILYRIFFDAFAFKNTSDFIYTAFIGVLGILFIYSGIERNRLKHKKKKVRAIRAKSISSVEKV